MTVRLDIAPFDVGAALALSDTLGVSFPVAQILLRRGLADEAAARAFLSASDEHDPQHFDGIAVAVETVLRHVSAATRITIHGDYDVDGVCSTAILVRTLRALGGNVDWYLPGRTEDGYGLAAATVERLAARGTRLLITADCAITAVDEVAAARAAGMDVVVTDHHSTRSDGALPDAPIVHPAVCGYPCVDLCAAGVAHKFSLALLAAAGADPAVALEDLDLVALATVADCVPLVGENRRLVRMGLAALSATRKPGLRALMRVSKADPGALDETAIGFRLAPRLNAAGRMQRADAALELVLTEDADRAAEVADELDRLNSERRHVEERIRFAAEAQVAAAGDQPAYVLAGEDWHPGVIGIVASRIAERHNRPVVMIAMAGETGTGSGRSIPAFDLLGGLNASSAHLLRHGGHRAAAGCTIERGSVDAFRAAFVAHAAATLTEADYAIRERADAVVAGDELGLALAEDLARLAPFGIGNPAPALLVPGARLVDARPMGEGKHIRFTVRTGGLQARAVAFGMGSLPAGSESGVAATFRLERNEWQGAVEPRLVLRKVIDEAPPPIALAGEPDDWGEAVQEYADTPVSAFDQTAPTTAAGWSAPGVRDRRGGGIAGVIGALVASGEPVVVVCADARLRHQQLGAVSGGFTLTSWPALERDSAVVSGAAHIVVLDPPSHPSALDALIAATPSGTTHLAWGEDELRFAEHVHAGLHALREPLAATYRALRDGAGLPAALGRDAERPWSPVLAGRVLRVMLELDLVDVEGGGSLRPVAGRVDLELSATYRACLQRLAQGERWLTSARPLAA